MNRLEKPRDSEHFREKPLEGQKHDREVGGVRRIDVFRTDVLREAHDAGSKRLYRGVLFRRVAGVVGVHQPGVILRGELRVDRKPHGSVRLVLSRNFHRELDLVVRTLFCFHVPLVLGGRENLLENSGQLILAQNALRLHVRQHLFQVADSGRERLHLAQALLHELEPLAHQFERLAEPRLQRLVELLVDRLAHLFELLAVLRLDCLQLFLHRVADLVEVLPRVAVELGHLRSDLFLERRKRSRKLVPVVLRRDVHRLLHPGELLLEQGGEAHERSVELVPRRLRRTGRLIPVPRKFLPENSFHPVEPSSEFLDSPLPVCRAALAGSGGVAEHNQQYYELSEREQSRGSRDYFRHVNILLLEISIDVQHTTIGGVWKTKGGI